MRDYTLTVPDVDSTNYVCDGKDLVRIDPPPRVIASKVQNLTPGKTKERDGTDAQKKAVRDLLKGNEERVVEAATFGWPQGFRDVQRIVDAQQRLVDQWKKAKVKALIIRCFGGSGRPHLHCVIFDKKLSFEQRQRLEKWFQFREEGESVHFDHNLAPEKLGSYLIARKGPNKRVEQEPPQWWIDSPVDKGRGYRTVELGRSPLADVRAKAEERIDAEIEKGNVISLPEGDILAISKHSKISPNTKRFFNGVSILSDIHRKGSDKKGEDTHSDKLEKVELSSLLPEGEIFQPLLFSYPVDLPECDHRVFDEVGGVQTITRAGVSARVRRLDDRYQVEVMHPVKGRYNLRRASLEQALWVANRELKQIRPRAWKERLTLAKFILHA